MLKKCMMLLFIGTIIYSATTLAAHDKKLSALSASIDNSFIGIWTGSCDTGGSRGESKWKVDIRQHSLTITEDDDIIETSFLNEVSAGTKSAAMDDTYHFYIQNINKLRLGSGNNLILDSVLVDTDLNSNMAKSFSVFSDTYTFSLKNNQLIVDEVQRIKVSLEDKEVISDTRCVLNKS